MLSTGHKMLGQKKNNKTSILWGSNKIEEEQTTQSNENNQIPSWNSQFHHHRELHTTQGFFFFLTKLQFSTWMKSRFISSDHSKSTKRNPIATENNWAKQLSRRENIDRFRKRWKRRSYEPAERNADETVDPASQNLKREKFEVLFSGGHYLVFTFLFSHGN